MTLCCFALALWLVPAAGLADCWILTRDDCDWSAPPTGDVELSCGTDIVFRSCEGFGGIGGGIGGGGGGGGQSGAPLSGEQQMTLFQAKNLFNDAMMEPACASLFQKFPAGGTWLAQILSADGLEQLAGVTFRSVETCGTNVPAYTSIGGNVIYICPAYVRLSPTMAGVILFHELLHTAGLVEALIEEGDGINPARGDINDTIQATCNAL